MNKGEYKVLWKMRRMAKSNGELEMSVYDIARAAEYTTGGTRKIIHRLVAAGEFERVYRKRGSQLPNLYRHLDLR